MKTANLVIQHFVQGIPRSDGWFQRNSGQVICHDDVDEDWGGNGELDYGDDEYNGDSSGSGQV